LRIAYFINQYPKVSHSFIRREIMELENQGLEVMRYSVQRERSDVIDPDDITELEKTTYLAAYRKPVIICAVLQQLLHSPVQWLQACAVAFRLGRISQVGVARHAVYFIEACVLLDQLRENGIRHVHAHFGTNSTTVVMLAKLLGDDLSFSFTVHGPEEFDKPEALSLGEKIRHAAFVAAISSFGRSQLFRWCDHEHWNKIHIIHCALDTAFLDAEPTPVPNNHRLVCVGRLCEQKGQILLIAAMHRIKEKGISVELVLAGDGPMRNEIEQMIEHYDLGQQVRITGWISSAQVREEIVNSRALVLPSFAEGLPVVLMEACALRRPSVTTCIAGIPELIHSGKCGWLITPGSVDSLSLALGELLKASTDRLSQMGKYGYEQVSLYHDARIESARLHILFQEVLEAS